MTPGTVATMTSRQRYWEDAAACRGADTNAMFGSEDQQTRTAAKLCAGCPVVGECLSHALDYRVKYGVWGGTTEWQRRTLRRQQAAGRSGGAR